MEEKWKQYLPTIEESIRYCKDKDDVRQEAQLAVWLAIKSYNGKGSLDKWVRIQMWNAIKNYTRRERNERIRYDGHYTAIAP